MPKLPAPPVLPPRSNHPKIAARHNFVLQASSEFADITFTFNSQQGNSGGDDHKDDSDSKRLKESAQVDYRTENTKSKENEAIQKTIKELEGKVTNENVKIFFHHHEALHSDDLATLRQIARDMEGALKTIKPQDADEQQLLPTYGALKKIAESRRKLLKLPGRYT